jgi:hypothetical protein
MTDDELAEWLDVMAGNNTVESGHAERVLTLAASRLRELCAVRDAVKRWGTALASRDAAEGQHCWQGCDLCAAVHRAEDEVIRIRDSLAALEERGGA